MILSMKHSATSRDRRRRRPNATGDPEAHEGRQSHLIVAVTLLGSGAAVLFWLTIWRYRLDLYAHIVLLPILVGTRVDIGQDIHTAASWLGALSHQPSQNGGQHMANAM